MEERGGGVSFTSPAEDSAVLVPFGFEDVAVFVEGDAVWRGDDVVLPACWRHVGGIGFGVGIIDAEFGDHFSLFVPDGDAACDFGDAHQLAVEGGGAWAAHILGDDAEVFAIERGVEDSIVAAVAEEKAFRGEARIDVDLVAVVEFESVLWAAELLFEFS